VRGIISFVGLGPGDSTLRTERAAARIADADAVIQGDDVAPDALVERARVGQRVVRAVAGDPLESPRVLAEALAVARAGIPIEVVPGLGAQAVAAAFAGSVGSARWVHAAGVGTSLTEEAADRVVTLVARPGSPRQRVVVTTAAKAADEALTLGDELLVLVLGAPDPLLTWFERRPLFGKRVLVTRAHAQAESAATLLRDQGAEPVVVPTIEIHAPRDPQPLTRALHELMKGVYAWVAFTSANGVERTWAALVAIGADARIFGGARLAAIGPATARALEAHGLRADVVAQEFHGEGLAQEMLTAIRSGPPSPSVLLARAARARDVLPETLRAAGCKVDVVAAYETLVPSRETADALVHALEFDRVDAVTLTSSSTVDNLCDLLGPKAVPLLRSTRVASIGPVTTATAQARGVRVDVTARQYTVPGLLEVLAESYESAPALSLGQ
jgi:uroporphyrinogen III methyltransferase / synthase